MKHIFAIVLIFGLYSASSGVEKPGSISGRILDKTTLQALVGADVLVKDTNKGAASDANGEFKIANLIPGSYNIEVRYLGYKTFARANVIVNPNRSTVLEFRLEENPLPGQTLEVTASYFEKPKEAVVSARSMDFEEIRRSPGDLVDIQRAVQALPAVVSGSDQINEIIIRGGYPGENLFLMDNIEIPNPNHFAIQGAGGGPINMLNSYMVRSVDFYAGAFSARYGDKASSVMDISLRAGATERLRAEGSMGMAGLGVLVEGPIASKGSFIFSARKSYLDLIISSTGLTAVPRYNNLQGKMTLALNPKNSLLINSVYGNDKINIEEGDEAGYGRGAENVDTRNSQYINGMSLRTFWTPTLYSFTTLSAVRSDFFVDVYEKPLPNRKHTFFTNESRETEYSIKSDFTYQIHKNLEMNFGASLKNVRFDYNVWNEADTLYLHNYQGNKPDSVIGIFRTYPEFRVDRNVSSAKQAAYAQFSLGFWNHFRVNTGLRYDYFAYNHFGSFSPRLGLSYFLSSLTTLNFAYGRHYQSPSYIELAANRANNRLRNKYNNQYVVGIEHLFREDIKLVLEAYIKEYHDIPVVKTLTTVDPFDFDDGTYLNAGSGSSRGLELFLQKKLTHNFSSIISYSHSVAKTKDPRNQRTFNGDYDYRDVFTFMAGYKLVPAQKQWYQNLKRKTWFHFLAWVPVFPADEFELSLKFRFLGGRPYTAPVYHPELREWAIEEQQQLNNSRYPDYHRLDFRIDRRFIFNSWNLVVFFDLVNIYNRDNIWSYQYNDNGSRDNILQYKTLPVGGVSLEF